MMLKISTKRHRIGSSYPVISGRVGAVQTAILHPPLFQEGVIGINVGFEAPQRLEVGVIERFGEYLPRKSEIQIEYLNSECFLRGEVVLNEPCGTPAASTTSRTLAPAKP